MKKFKFMFKLRKFSTPSMSLFPRCKKQLTEKCTGHLFRSLGYSFGKTIGKGTYSKVCTAKNKYGQTLACKIINKKYAGEDFNERFLPRELSIITMIRHPNIVTVYKILEVNNVIYMFMDFCQKGDLLEFIKNYGHFSEQKSKKIFKQLTSAVEYLHSKNIAHRDLKCENVMLMADNRIKIGDFGFARHSVNSSGENVLSNTFCGSAAYAAPEILQGIRYDPKKYDIWALGCILYIMLSATMPFDDKHIKRMVSIQLNRDIFSKILKWSKTSQSLKLLLCSLLEPEAGIRVSIRDVMACDWLQDIEETKQDVEL